MSESDDEVTRMTSDINAFNKTLIEEFRANDGRVSGMFSQSPLLLLTHTGAKSGEARTSPLVYSRDGDRIVIIASKGGSAKHPHWYLNIVADPTVTVLLGPVVHESIPVYASLTWLGDADRVCADAQRALDHGIRAVKLHEANVELILEVRRRLGPEVTLMVDASARFDEHGAIDAADRLADADLAWFEEPLYPQSDHAALARVRSVAPMPIAAGENEFSLAGFERLIASGAVDILQPEIAKFGGITPARGVGVPLCPHNYSLGPSLLANIHWAMTAPAARWLEVPWLSEGGSFPCAMPMPALVDGCVLPPTAPGLGYTGR